MQVQGTDDSCCGTANGSTVAIWERVITAEKRLVVALVASTIPGGTVATINAPNTATHSCCRSTTPDRGCTVATISAIMVALLLPSFPAASPPLTPGDNEAEATSRGARYLWHSNRDIINKQCCCVWYPCLLCHHSQ